MYLHIDVWCIHLYILIHKLCHWSFTNKASLPVGVRELLEPFLGAWSKRPRVLLWFNVFILDKNEISQTNLAKSFLMPVEIALRGSVIWYSFIVISQFIYTHFAKSVKFSCKSLFNWSYQTFLWLMISIRKWFAWCAKNAIQLLLNCTITIKRSTLSLAIIFISKWWSTYTVIQHFGDIKKRWGLYLICLDILMMGNTFTFAANSIFVVFHSLTEITGWDVHVSGTNQDCGHFIEVSSLLCLLFYWFQLCHWSYGRLPVSLWDLH